MERQLIDDDKSKFESQSNNWYAINKNVENKYRRLLEWQHQFFTYDITRIIIIK